MTRFLNVAVEGCCHGELDTIYQAIAENERKTRRKVDLLLVCGDFECVRDIVDLECLAVPTKYRKLNSFHQYVTGEKVAPVTTIFVGGNHEASNVLQSLYYGGWVAPKIYFLGFAGVINFRGLRIAGLSGIFNQKHYRAGHFETPPYTEDTLRSVYHMRELEVFRMAHLVQSDHPVDVFLSHDWPAGIWDFGNRERLLKVKPYFREDMQSGKLGNPPLMHLLHSIKPSYWFAAHLHVKFAATVVHPPEFHTTALIQPPQPPQESQPAQPSQASTQLPPDSAAPSEFRPPPPSAPMPLQEKNNADGHDSSSSSNSELGKRAATDPVSHNSSSTDAFVSAVNPRVTQFLALDKVLPGREFLHFLQIPVQTSAGHFHSEELEFDPEWLAVLCRTHTLLQTHRGDVRLPQQVDKISSQEIADVRERLTTSFGSLEIPPIGPYIPPVIIAGECIAPPRRLFHSINSHAGQKETTFPPHPLNPATLEHSDSGDKTGEKATHSISDSASESDFIRNNDYSGFADVHFTKESYAQQVAMEMEKLQQQERYAAQGLPPPPYHQMNQLGGRGGRGAARGAPQQQHHQQQQFSYYGPGGTQASHSQQSHQGGRHGGRGGGRGAPTKNHNMLFNPSSRVTALGNTQTDALLQALGLKHFWTRPCLDAAATSAPTAFNAASVEPQGGGEGSVKEGNSSTAAGHAPAPPTGPPPRSLNAAPDHESEDGASSDSTVQRSAPLGALTLAPLPHTTAVPTTLPNAAVDDKYGLHAYYGSGPAYYTAPTATSATTPLVTAESASDPLEIDIDDDEAPVATKSSVQGADPSEISLDEEEATEVKSTPTQSVEKEVDPNAIDLDF